MRQFKSRVQVQAFQSTEFNHEGHEAHGGFRSDRNLSLSDLHGPYALYGINQFLYLENLDL